MISISAHDADVVIIAGCGIHNCGVQDSEHDGRASLFRGKECPDEICGEALRRGGRKRPAHPESPDRSLYWKREATRRWRWSRSRAWIPTKRDESGQAGGRRQTDCKGAPSDSWKPGCGERLCGGAQRGGWPAADVVFAGLWQRISPISSLSLKL